MAKHTFLPEGANFVQTVQPLRIGGKSFDRADRLEVLNPSDGKPLATIARAGRDETGAAIAAAKAAFDDGSRTTMSAHDRGRIVWNLADAIEDNVEALAQLDTLDNGKPHEKARGDVEWSARHFRYFAGWPDQIEGATIPVSTPDRLKYTRISPVGVCGLITPLNYPLSMASWKLAPGNTVVLKPSEETSLSALYFADPALEAGLPPSVLNVIPGYGRDAGAVLAAHDHVAKIGFTGSNNVGRHIVAASTGNLKKVSLELGGKAGNVIFEDADLDRAIPGAFWANFGNNGQSCMAGARLYIHENVYDQVRDGIVALAKGISVGPGLDQPGHDLGPVINERQMTKILGYVEGAVAEGASILTGGTRQGREGWFILPTVIDAVEDRMTIACEEVFGPVLTLHRFNDDADVVARVNATPYGLAVGLWSRDITRLRRMADALLAGTIWVNCWGETDAASPFGGMKQSGYGREMGKDAIELYSETKSIWLA
ncbi:MAG: aldehyde dehydrogenase family protein [Rhodobacteraceae bacterium]|nr:aldehyde dehydrogenase family protein [Paracoccaceae bacterium]